MKKHFSIKVYFVSILILCLAGCEKESSDSEKLLVGKWNQLSTRRIDYYDNVKQNETTTTYESGKLILEIYEDGTATRFLNGVISESFYWIIDGNILTTTNDNGVIIKSEFTVNKTELNLQWAVQSTTDGHVTRSDYSTDYKKAE